MSVNVLRSLSPSEETDSEVIARSLVDPGAFSVVFDRHWPRIHRFCVSRAGGAGEDVAAEVFCVAFDERSGYLLKYADAAPWLFGVASNLLARHFRRAERATRALPRLEPVEAPDHADDAIGRVEAAVLAPQLAAALAETSAVDRDALLLHVWGELSYSEIAVATGVPVGTVRSRIHRARAAFRSHVNQPGKVTS